MKIVKEPIYQQLIKILKTVLESDEFEIGDKFLSESEISKTYEISRNTVNKAVSTLIGQGFLEFKKGIGTFVQFKKSQYDLHTLISFTKMAETIEKKPTTEVLEFKKIDCSEIDKEIKTALQLEENESLYYMKRLRLLDERPSIVEERYVKGSLCPNLKKSDVSKSILSMWQNKYHLKLAGADQTLRASLLDQANALLLKENAGDPIFLRESTGYLENDVPLWFERTIFCGKDYLFRFKLESLNLSQAATSVFIGD